MTLESTFAESDGGGRIYLPCQVIPNKKTDVPEHLRVNAMFLEAGQNGVPWTGYFAMFRGAKQAVCMYQGVWFEIRYDKTKNEWYAFRVARAALNLLHEPASNMNIDELRAQTLV